MKQNETLLNIMENDELMQDDSHFSTSLETPLRPDAFKLTEEQKIEKIEHHFREILTTLGMDLNDDSLNKTPYRVAKMYVKEIFSGLDPNNKPKVSLFENKFGYNQMLVEKDINVNSQCEHHLVPIFGKAHVAYIANGEVIGLSKINRIVDYYCKRPQVQERLTRQIAEELKQVLKTEDVAVVLDAKHMCVSSRGIKDVNSSTITAAISGQFQNEATRLEFLRYIGMNSSF
ncbi:MAG: GTP cyclohydrolase I FolE [Bacteroidetes bacterium MED-G17]|nr:MAG: GTP cyclohydrolase I FolE [Bacteroidetes bacterium TMED39]PDH52371.1 MAG: GTP cyclohydrolase I FolE [Bacteroidetes bacterium MED-G17]